jgi:hypothetical protein
MTVHDNCRQLELFCRSCGGPMDHTNIQVCQFNYCLKCLSTVAKTSQTIAEPLDGTPSGTPGSSLGSLASLLSNQTSPVG